MGALRFLNSRSARVLKVAIGAGLLVEGTVLGTLGGLVMMMAGVVLVVTGIAGVSLVEEAVHCWYERRAASPRTGEHET